ncbi:hypothetical protein [Pseudomonas fluorescens]|uniref:Uncharacterized protein n=1 Tax=Pseudomonas fluorescens TaxID=294 RepID=A0A5E7LBX6_PSEFL|nr:hypothetical protein [Pseudomonas fluorescens]VVP11680.1 hypothetical protein PS854_03332 [Pseudomonas fluorescens]
MEDQFYLQDSRSNTGDGLMFWAEGGGYCTDLGRAEIFTKARAIRYHEDRETDVPWPKAYIDERSHLGVDCQYVSEEEAAPLLVDGCVCVVQIKGQWNGNDLIWAKWPIGGSPKFEQAHQLDFATAQRLTEDEIIWPLTYIEGKTRHLVHAGKVSIGEALIGTGIKLIKPKKPRQQVFNCSGCGRFITDIQRYQNDCRNCGANNCP